MADLCVTLHVDMTNLFMCLVCFKAAALFSIFIFKDTLFLGLLWFSRGCLWTSSPALKRLSNPCLHFDLAVRVWIRSPIVTVTNNNSTYIASSLTAPRQDVNVTRAHDARYDDDLVLIIAAFVLNLFPWLNSL